MEGGRCFGRFRPVSHSPLAAPLSAPTAGVPMTMPAEPVAEIFAPGEAPDASADATTDADAMRRLHASLAEGNHWCMAMLEAIALWRSSHETLNGRTYTYLIAGEAFDWLELADRLLLELGDLVPEDEREALLFQGKLPLEVTPWEFQRTLGRVKYRAHLNFWYGVLVEEALLVAVEERMAKEGATIGLSGRSGRDTAIYQWVYGLSLQELLAAYAEQRGVAPTDTMSLAEHRAFTYWCFKHRLEHRDPAKVASDTRLGLAKLQAMYARYGRRPMVL